MDFTESIKKNNILLKSKSTNRWELIEELIDLAVKNKEIEESDCDEIKKNLTSRERSMSTGIGNGVAIPHCTTAKIKDIVFLMSIIPNGMDFDSIDNQLVKIIILLLVPKNKLSQHIKTLANIAKLMSNENLRKKITTLKTPESIIKALKDHEKVKNKNHE